MTAFLEDILKYRANHEYDTVSSSSVTVRELADNRLGWCYLAIIRGPKIFQVERWLNDNYDEDTFRIAAGASGIHVYFDDGKMGLHIKMTWTI